jgi:hypothetical protein
MKIETIYLVLNPTPESTLLDVLAKMSVYEFMMFSRAKGAHEDVFALFTDKVEAEKVALEELRKVR